MYLRCLSPLLAGLGVCAALLAVADSAETRRTIGKEPAYQSKSPRYCLLTFGERADTQVWLVLDGDSLYADRNGNGDLTQAEEKVAAESTRELGSGGIQYVFPLGEIKERDGKTKHPRGTLCVNRTAGDIWALQSVTVSVRGAYTECVGTPGAVPLGRGPADAPVLEFNGGLTLVTYVAHLARGRATDLRVHVIAASARNRQLAPLVLCDSVPKDLHPVAEIEFPGRTQETRIRLKASLKGRC